MSAEDGSASEGDAAAEQPSRPLSRRALLTGATGLLAGVGLGLAGCRSSHPRRTGSGVDPNGPLGSQNGTLGSQPYPAPRPPYPAINYATAPPTPSPTATPSPIARPAPPVHLDPPAGDSPPIYLGVWQPGAPQQLAGIEQFEALAGKHVAIVHWYDTWSQSPNGPNTALFAAVAAHGSVPLLSWGSEDANRGPVQPQYSLASILAGRWDDYLSRWAAAVAAYGGPLLLRWNWEMNGNWYPWGVDVQGNTAQQFVDVWRRVHDSFIREGATNIQWVWSPNVVLGHEFPLESVYPGDAYVDWMALDGFNHLMYGWRSFSDLFYPSYARLVAMSDRPIMIAETSSSEAGAGAPRGASKAGWISSALTEEIPNTFPHVRALIWFNDNKSGVESNGYDWRIESSESAQKAFAAAVASPIYSGNWLPTKR